MLARSLTPRVMHLEHQYAVTRTKTRSSRHKQVFISVTLFYIPYIEIEKNTGVGAPTIPRSPKKAKNHLQLQVYN